MSPFTNCLFTSALFCFNNSIIFFDILLLIKCTLYYKSNCIFIIYGKLFLKYIKIIFIDLLYLSSQKTINFIKLIELNNCLEKNINFIVEGYYPSTKFIKN